MQNTELDMNLVNGSEHAPRSIRVHGGNLADAARQYGLSEKNLIDFSANINPLGAPASSLRAARRALEYISRYPDPAVMQLRRAIARYFGIKPEHIICGNGSSSFIHLIPRAFKARKVLVPIPAFTEYAAAAQEAGAEVVPMPLQERTGFRVDPLEMAFALKGMDMAFLCNPNNPTGLLIPKVEMLEIARYALEQGVRLVIDEAYMDFVNSETMVKEAIQASHIICLRGFTTFFGMPGLRIGYAVSNEDMIGRLRAAQEPWAVNLPAEHAAIAALEDWRYAKKTVRLIEKEREHLLAAIRILPGVESFPCSANFVFIKIAASKAPLLVEKLAVRGFLVRDCASFPGLDNQFIRIGVRTRADNKRLVRALRELLK